MTSNLTEFVSTDYWYVVLTTMGILGLHNSIHTLWVFYYRLSRLHISFTYLNEQIGVEPIYTCDKQQVENTSLSPTDCSTKATRTLLTRPLLIGEISIIVVHPLLVTFYARLCIA